MHCPSCHQTLKSNEYEGVEIEICPGCGGEWLDADELGKIVRRREVRFDESACRGMAETKPIEGVPTEAFERVLICPKCGGKTQPINYGGDSGIILDRCGGCGGFWLDAEELERVQMIVEGWDDRLPEVMRELGPELQQVEAENRHVGEAQVSHLPVVGRFINALVNRLARLSD